jgi:hypothetical protein
MAGYEMETCPDCGAQLAIVGVVLDPGEIQFALASRGLLAPIEPITNSPSRGRSDFLPSSPQLELDLFPVSPDEPEPEPDEQPEARRPSPAAAPPAPSP